MKQSSISFNMLSQYALKALKTKTLTRNGLIQFSRSRHCNLGKLDIVSMSDGEANHPFSYHVFEAGSDEILTGDNLYIKNPGSASYNKGEVKLLWLDEWVNIPLELSDITHYLYSKFSIEQGQESTNFFLSPDSFYKSSLHTKFLPVCDSFTYKSYFAEQNFFIRYIESHRYKTLWILDVQSLAIHGDKNWLLQLISLLYEDYPDFKIFLPSGMFVIDNSYLDVEAVLYTQDKKTKVVTRYSSKNEFSKQGLMSSRVLSNFVKLQSTGSRVFYLDVVKKPAIEFTRLTRFYDTSLVREFKKFGYFKDSLTPLFREFYFD